MQVPVEMRLWFERLIEIDTKDQRFTAEIYLQAKWQEPKLAGKTQNVRNFTYQ